MSVHSFVTCDCCNTEIKPEEDGPYQSRPEFERNVVRLSGEEKPVRYISRRDLCQSCGLRIRQALLQVPESLWLLEGFEVIK